MGEDKLTHAERVRLESLSQAFNMGGHTGEKRPTVQDVLDAAEKIEGWLKTANGH